MLTNTLLLLEISIIYATKFEHTTFMRKKHMIQTDIHEYSIATPELNLTCRHTHNGLFKPEQYELIIRHSNLISALPKNANKDNIFAHDVYELLSNTQRCIPLTKVYKNTIKNIILNNSNHIEQKQFTQFGPIITYYEININDFTILTCKEHNKITKQARYNLVIDCSNPSIKLPAHYNSQSPEQQQYNPGANNFAQKIFNLMHKLHVR